MRWSDEAERLLISPLTRPQEVHSFIHHQPGLLETCEMFPQLLVEYAPQLVIPGMSGEFEALFTRLYEDSVNRQSVKRKEGSLEGTALTTDGGVPLCDEEWALRDPEFGRYSAVDIAHDYFSGGMFGPPVSPYKHADHLAWLLSNDSNWLPESIHDVLLAGMAGWGAWLWTMGDWPSAGALAEALRHSDPGVGFRWSRRRKEDALGRLNRSVEELGLPETSDELLRKFIDYGFPQRWIASEERRRH
jgi:hypothetical protein